MKQRVAGIREAKERLSALLRDVQRGREWVIADRGKPVARLVPIGPETLAFDERVARLEARGIIAAPESAARPLPEPPDIDPRGLAQRYLQDDRNTR